jgi:hypothetical protein
VGDYPLWAQLRTAEREAAYGAVEALKKMVAAIRKRCRKARIIVRGDSGFCREEILAWCEGQPSVYYCLGLGKNSVLIEKLGPTMAQARARHCLTGSPSVREFTEFEYQTQESWSRSRRVIGKAEVMAEGENPRFVVTTLPVQGFKGDQDRRRFEPQRLYEELHCARGEMENLLKQQVLDLRGDRMSTQYLASNQFRLWEATFAYLLLERLRTWGGGGNGVGAGDRGERALEAVESSGPGASERAEGVGAVEQRLSAAKGVSALPSAVDAAGGGGGLRGEGIWVGVQRVTGEVS